MGKMAEMQRKLLEVSQRAPVESKAHGLFSISTRPPPRAFTAPSSISPTHTANDGPEAMGFQPPTSTGGTTVCRDYLFGTCLHDTFSNTVSSTPSASATRR
jgi:hypothetical protein